MRLYVIWGLITSMTTKNHGTTSKTSRVLSKIFTPVTLVLYLTAIVFIASGWLWWNKVYNNEDRVFWDMISNNLKTSSFTQVSITNDGYQRVEQKTQVQTVPKRIANSATKISQTGADVSTESIGTPTTDYVQYTSVVTSQTASNGSPLDFSGIQNIWGKTEIEYPNMTNGQLYTQSVMSVVPFGKLSSVERSNLMNAMKTNQAYSPKLTEITREGIRPVYTFTVKIKASAYVLALQQFGKYFGLNQLDELDASQYESASDVEVTMKIDGWSHQLREISYGEGSRLEKFSAFGSTKQLPVPPADQDTISINELQYRLQSIQ